MSYEGGVMPSDVVRDITPQEVTPLWGQRGSRYMAGTGQAHMSGALTPGNMYCRDGVESVVKLPWGGVYAGQGLSLAGGQEGRQRKAMIDNRTRESRLSGMGRGLGGNVDWGGSCRGCHPRTLKRQCGWQHRLLP